MRRIKLILAVASTTAVMMVVTAAPALADVKIGSNGFNSSHGFTSVIGNSNFGGSSNTVLFNSFDSVFDDVDLDGFEIDNGSDFDLDGAVFFG